MRRFVAMRNTKSKVIILWVNILLYIILITVSYIIYVLYVLSSIQNPRNLPISKPILWKDNEGIFKSSNGGKTFDIYRFKDQHGKIINDTPFTFRKYDIIYWSPTDYALRVISDDGHSIWISLRDKLPPKWNTYSIQSCRDGIVINGCVYDSKPECFILDFGNEHVKIIPEAIEAKSKYPSQSIAVLNSLHQIILPDKELQKMLLHPGISIEHWAYDPISSAICIADDTHVMVFNDNSSYNWMAPLFCWIHDVEIIGKLHQVWVSVGLPYSARQLLLIYSYNGNFLGNRLSFPTPISSPIMDVNSKMIDLLDTMKSVK